MSDVWVYKPDGTLQCGMGAEIPLETMQVELENLGGAVLEATKATSCQFFSTVCGAPTGRVNAYLITEGSAETLFSGIVGPSGFRRWDCDGDPMNNRAVQEGESDAPEPVFPWPWGQASSVNSTPVLCRELIGRVARVYHQGDVLTEDFRPERVNIELDADGRIADIWFG